MHELTPGLGIAIGAIVLVLLFALFAPAGTVAKGAAGFGNGLQWLVRKVAAIFGKKY